MDTKKLTLTTPRIAFLLPLAIGITLLLFWVVQDFLLAILIAAVLAGQDALDELVQPLDAIDQGAVGDQCLAAGHIMRDVGRAAEQGAVLVAAGGVAPAVDQTPEGWRASATVFRNRSRSGKGSTSNSDGDSAKGLGSALVMQFLG